MNVVLTKISVVCSLGCDRRACLGPRWPISNTTIICIRLVLLYSKSVAANSDAG